MTVISDHLEQDEALLGEAGVESLEELLADLNLFNIDSEDEGPIFQSNVNRAMHSLESGLEIRDYLRKYFDLSLDYHRTIAAGNPDVTPVDYWTEMVEDFCETIIYTITESDIVVDQVTAERWVSEFEDILEPELKKIYGKDTVSIDAITESMIDLKKEYFPHEQ